jgi:DNA-directed RNA polymerase subunit L
MSLIIPLMVKFKLRDTVFPIVDFSCDFFKIKSLIKLSSLFNLGNVDTKKVSFISSICSCLLYMHAEVTHAKDKELEFRILNLDISILYIIQHEIQKNDDVKFAGVILKHPLIREYMLKILTARSEPQKSLLDSIDLSIQYTNDLSGILKLTLGK